MNTTKDEKSSTPDRAHQPVVADRNQRGVGGLAWALTAGSALLLLLAVVLLALNRELGWRALSPHLFVVPGFAVVGLVLAVRRPGHPIGWLFVAMGLVAAIPAAVFYNFFSSRIKVLGSMVDDFALEFLNIVERNFT